MEGLCQECANVELCPDGVDFRWAFLQLVTAARAGHQNCLDVLLKAGADVNQANFDGKTAFTVCRKIWPR